MVSSLFELSDKVLHLRSVNVEARAGSVDSSPAGPSADHPPATAAAAEAPRSPALLDAKYYSCPGQLSPTLRGCLRFDLI